MHSTFNCATWWPQDVGNMTAPAEPASTSYLPPLPKPPAREMRYV